MARDRSGARLMEQSDSPGAGAGSDAGAGAGAGSAGLGGCSGIRLCEGCTYGVVAIFPYPRHEGETGGRVRTARRERAGPGSRSWTGAERACVAVDSLVKTSAAAGRGLVQKSDWLGRVSTKGVLREVCVCFLDRGTCELRVFHICTSTALDARSMYVKVKVQATQAH